MTTIWNLDAPSTRTDQGGSGNGGSATSQPRKKRRVTTIWDLSSTATPGPAAAGTSTAMEERPANASGRRRITTIWDLSSGAPAPDPGSPPRGGEITTTPTPKKGNGPNRVATIQNVTYATPAPGPDPEEPGGGVGEVVGKPVGNTASSQQTMNGARRKKRPCGCLRWLKALLASAKGR